MDAAFISRLQRNDHATYDELVAQYGDELYGYIYHMTHDRQQSEALLAATFLRVVQQIGRYNAVDAAFTTWLYRIASTVTRNARTTTKRRVRVPQRTVLGAPIGAPAAIEPLFQPAEVQDALNTLPIEQRQLILLRCAADMDLEEIGYIVGKPTRAVEQLQLQALRAFHSLLM